MELASDVEGLRHVLASVLGDRLPRQGGVSASRLRLRMASTVAEQIRKTIAATYVGSTIEDREATFTLAWRRSPDNRRSEC